jgi:hypothetical protein
VWTEWNPFTHIKSCAHTYKHINIRILMIFRRSTPSNVHSFEFMIFCYMMGWILKGFFDKRVKNIMNKKNFQHHVLKKLLNSTNWSKGFSFLLNYHRCCCSWVQHISKKNNKSNKCPFLLPLCDVHSRFLILRA